MTSSRLLITGASGFVGRALAFEAAAREVPLRVAVRRPDSGFPAVAEVVRIAGLDPGVDWSAALSGIDAIAHCAARAHVMRERVRDPLAEFRRVNVDGTVELATQAARAGVRRFIFLSSIGVNGTQTTDRPFTAEDPPAPSQPYSTSKLEAEQSLTRIARQSGMELTIIRPPLIYGPGARGNFGLLVRLIESRLPLPLGAVHNKRSLVALHNLVDLVLACRHHPAARNETLLVSDGQDISTTDLLRHLGHVLGKPAWLVPVPERVLHFAGGLLGQAALTQKLLGSLQIDSTRTRDILGWKPPLTLDDGLQRVAATRGR